MINIVIIGMTGEGKSEYVKKFIEGKNCIVNDVNDEYGNRTKYEGQKPLLLSTDTNKNRSRYIKGDFNEYLKICLAKKNTVCIFEESTGFIQGKIGATLRKILINKVHTKNVNILIFHSILDCPPGILRLCNYCILYRTADEPNYIESKYPSLLKYYEIIKKQPKGSYLEIKLI